MTDTEPRTATLDAPAHARAEAWLADFEEALTAHDIDRASAMFAPTSFWRDVIPRRYSNPAVCSGI